MKQLKWNLGIIILRIGYALRGNIPQKTWKILLNKDFKNK